MIIDKPTEDIEEYVSSCAWEAGFEHGMVIVPVVYPKKNGKLDLIGFPS